MQNTILADCWIKDKKHQTIIRVIVLIVITVLMCGYAVYAYKESVRPAMEQGGYEESFRNYKALTVGEKMTDKDCLVQEILVENKLLSAIDLHILNFTKKGSSSILIMELRDADTSECIEKWEKNASELHNALSDRFVLDEALQCEGKRHLQIVLTAKNTDEGNTFLFYEAPDESYEGSFYKNDEKQDRDIEFALQFGKKENTRDFFSGYYCMIVVSIIGFVLLLTGILLFKKNIRIETVYVAAVLFFGIVYLFVLPPFTAPDEFSHFASAYRNSNLILGVDGYKARNCDVGSSFGYLLDNDSYRIMAEDADKLAQSEELEYGGQLPSDKYNSAYSIQYWPQTLGILIAKTLHMGYVQMLFMGRICNLLFYVLCMYFAIRMIPYGKICVMSVSLLPMMVSLTASYSYDVVINSLVVLFTAYVFYLAYEKEKIGWRQLFLLAVLFLMIVPCKGVYSVVGLLVFFIPKKKLAVKISKKGKIAAAAAVFLAAVFMLRGFWPTIATLLQNSDTSIIYDGSEGYTVQRILSEPVHSAVFLIKSIAVNARDYVVTLVGGALGALNITIPSYITLFYLLLLFAAAFFCWHGEYTINGKKRIVSVILFILTGLGVMGIMWLAWTPLTANTIDGVQGRYLLPMMPMLLIAISNNRKKEVDCSREVIIAESVLHLFVCISVMENGIWG